MADLNARGLAKKAIEQGNELAQTVGNHTEQLETMTTELGKKIKSSKIKEIRDNGNVFEYSINEIAWKPVHKGSQS